MLPKYIYGIPLAVFLLSCSDGRDSAPNSTRYNEDAAAAELVLSSGTPTPSDESAEPEVDDDYLSADLTSFGVTVFGKFGLDVSLNDAMTYQATVSLRSALVRDSAVIDIDLPVSVNVASASTLSYEIHQATRNLMVKSTDTYQSAVTAALIASASDEGRMSEHIAYVTAAPSVQQTPVAQFLAASDYPRVEQNIALGSMVSLPVKASDLELVDAIDPASQIANFDAIHTGFVGNALYLVARVSSACPEDTFSLHIEHRLATESPDTSAATLALVQKGAVTCEDLHLVTLKFDLRPLLFHYESLHGYPFTEIKLGALGRYRPSSVPFNERRVYVDRPGCMAAADCQNVLAFEPDGQLHVQVSTPMHYQGTVRYIVSEDGARLYSTLLGETNHLSEAGTVLHVPSIGDLFLEK